MITVVESEEQRVVTRASLEKVLGAARLAAESRVLLRGQRDIQTIMADESAQADLAILGIGLPHEDDPSNLFFTRINQMLRVLPTTIIVHSARNFEGEPVLFSSEEEPFSSEEDTL